MPYLGSIIPAFDPTTAVSPQTDAERFSGNGSTTVFTLARTVSTAVDVDVYVENVKQEPTTAYSAAGTTLTFTAAPSSGTNNIYVLYRSFKLCICT
jgi:phage tail sheath gpL-like